MSLTNFVLMISTVHMACSILNFMLLFAYFTRSRPYSLTVRKAYLVAFVCSMLGPLTALSLIANGVSYYGFKMFPRETGEKWLKRLEDYDKAHNRDKIEERFCSIWED